MTTREANREILGHGKYWRVNKKMAREIGLEEAVFLSDLISKEEYFEDRGELDADGGFFNTAKNLQDDMGISEKAKKRIQKRLIEYGLVKIKKRGVPAKNYWYLQHENINRIMSSQAKNGPTGEAEKDTSSQAKNGPTSEAENGLAINNNKKEKQNNKNKVINIDQPTVDLVSDEKSLSRAEKKELTDRYYNSVTDLLSTRLTVNLPANTQKYIYGAIQREGIDRLLIAIKNYLADPYQISTEYSSIGKFFIDGFMIGRYAAKENNSEILKRCSKIIELYNGLTNTTHDPGNKFIIDAIINMSKAIGSLETVGKAVLASGQSEFHLENNQLDIMKVLKSPQLIIKYSGLYNRKQLERGIKNIVEKNIAPDIRMMSADDILQHDWKQYSNNELRKYLTDDQYKDFIKSNYDIHWLVSILTDLKESL